MRRTWLILAGVCAVVLLGLGVTGGDVSVSSDSTLTGLPLRLDFTLVQSARAANAPAPETAARAAPLRLKLDVAIAAESERGAVSAAQGMQPDSPEASAATPAAGAVRLDLLARTRDLGQATDAFGAKSWVVVPPPPPAAPPAPPMAPRAPPLPFRFMGQIDDGEGKRTFFLVRGTAALSVEVGESIDRTYLLERADGGVLVFNYLPLQERQSLTIGVGP